MVIDVNVGENETAGATATPVAADGFKDGSLRSIKS